MEREHIDLSCPFQSRISSIQWLDGANHKGLATLLRGNGDAVGDGTAKYLGQSPPRFIGCGICVFSRVEIQPGASGILSWLALLFKAAARSSMGTRFSSCNHPSSGRGFGASNPETGSPGLTIQGLGPSLRPARGF